LVVDSKIRDINTITGQMRTLALNALIEAAGSRITAAGEAIGSARTPGFETYPGLGWYGVIVQKPA
jgi:hypothetical protein